jgi:hypothetical protein
MQKRRTEKLILEVIFNYSEEEQEMTEKDVSGKWEKRALIISILSFILSIAGLVGSIAFSSYSLNAANQANSMTEKSLEMQNMISNSTPIIVANPEHGRPLDEGGYFSNVTASSPTVSRGWLNGSLTVITPHYGNVTVEIINFTVTDYYDYLIPDKENLTTVTTTLEYNYSQHVNYFISGLNPLNFNINLEASLYPNPQRLSNLSEAIFPIGVLFLEAKLFDAQAKITYTQVFTSVIHVTIRIV